LSSIKGEAENKRIMLNWIKYYSLSDAFLGL
jgi:hypothetical protein